MKSWTALNITIQQLNSAVSTPLWRKATVSHTESHTTKAQWICSEAETNAILLLRSDCGSDRDEAIDKCSYQKKSRLLFIVQELCGSRGGRPGLSVLTSFLVSVDVKLY